MKKILVFVVCLFVTGNIFAQITEIPKKPDYINDEFFYLRQAEHAYSMGEYGQAMKLCDTAREYRRAKIRWESYTLENSFRPREVSRVGDVMADIMPVLIRRDDADAIEIITRYAKRPSTVSYTTRASTLVAYIKSLTELPEADFMLGDVYYIEGEYSIAEDYYNKSWINRTLLDIPDQQFDILYRLADLSEMRGDEKTYEEYLTAVVRDDSFFKNENMQSALMRIIRMGRSGCVDNLFNLFRPDHYMMMRAYMNLSDLYNENGETDTALYMCALANLTAFTRMYSVVAQRSPDYVYTGFGNFIERASNYADVMKWAAENHVWQSLDNLVMLTRAKGYDSFADELSTVLSGMSVARR